MIARQLGLAFVLGVSLTLPLAASHVTQYPLPSRGTVSDSLFTTDGAVWVSTEAGLFRLDRQSGTFQSVYPEYLEDLVLGPDGRVWAQRESTVFRFDPVDATFTSTQFPGESVYMLAAGTDGTMWVVLTNLSTSRLVRLDLAGNVVSSVPVSDGYYDSSATAHVVTAHGFWYFNTIDGRLNLLKATGENQTFPEQLYNVYWLLATDDFLWGVSQDGYVVKIAFDGTVIARYTPNRTIIGAGVDAAGNVWFAEPDRLAEITSAGVYVVHETLPPRPCPDVPDWVSVAVSPAGEVAVTRWASPFPAGVPRPQPCLSQPGAVDTVTIIQPGHGSSPHEIPTAGSVALMLMTIMLAIAGVRWLR